MNKRRRKPAWMEMFPEGISVCVSLASFWLIMLFWNFVSPNELELVPRFVLASWSSAGVFLIAEVTGVIIMSLMKQKWEAEARADARFESLEESLKATLQETRAARTEAREARREAREEAIEAREREARTLETVLALMRRVEKLESEKANGERG